MNNEILEKIEALSKRLEAMEVKQMELERNLKQTIIETMQDEEKRRKFFNSKIHRG